MNAVATDDVSVVGVMKKSPKRSQTAINLQLKALRARVGFLERALRVAAREPRSLPALAGKRADAEDDARRKALADYYKQREIQYYLRNPNYLQIVIQNENERNEFLKARGLAPEASSIPPQFRRGLKKYQPTAKKPSSPG